MFVLPQLRPSFGHNLVASLPPTNLGKFGQKEILKSFRPFILFFEIFILVQIFCLVATLQIILNAKKLIIEAADIFFYGKIQHFLGERMQQCRNNWLKLLSNYI